MLRVEAWARVPSAVMAACFRREAQRWREHLEWDTTLSLAALDDARRHGQVPGFVTYDERGSVTGWTYYLLHDGDLQVGALVATSPAATVCLLDAVLGSPELSLAKRVIVFAFTEAPDLESALAQRGFDVGAAHYLTCRLPPAPSAADVLPTWGDDDAAEVADVLCTAYGADPRRAFAPSGLMADWHHYVQQLTVTAGCGQFVPALSPLAPAADGGLDGATIVTRLSPTTAHLAQLGVRPQAGGRGLGSRLLTAVKAGAAAHGCARLSLLVDDANAGGRRLYARHGFEPRAVFVNASRAHDGVERRRVGAPAA